MLALLLLPLLWEGSLQVDTELKVQVQDSVTVQEGLCTVVPCFFSFWSRWSSSPPRYIHWFQARDSPYFDAAVATSNPDKYVKAQTKGRFLLLGNTRNRNCSLSIKNAKIEDTGTYFLNVEKENGIRYNSEERLNLQVTALTEKPAIRFLEPLESGHPTQLNCSLPGSCPGGRPLSFSWTGGALQSLDPGTLHSSAITLTPRPQDHGTNLTCQVKLQNSHVTTERTVQLNVTYAPQNLTISVLGNGTALKVMNDNVSLLVQEGQSLNLVCVADSNPPAGMYWSWEEKSLNPSQVSESATLELPHIGAGDGGAFTCQAQHPLGSQHLSLSLSVQRSPSGCGCVTEEQEGSWALLITLIRGALMGAGFLLTYGLTWIYYTRCAEPQGSSTRRHD
ncbi:sialic acid-binding Ig-like lectin 14 [Otolemur garnettii]|uniref:sialic acid-binding Ig-like lectin 14 n=1 Tax=Otolemur garnettii TaxID=30611 RepID=UPI0006441289|nr:sialic acid-binding Ig-like lectin 14 [Otolemur garnettii]